MTVNKKERELAELAVEKKHLDDRLKLVRAKMKILSRDMTFPVVIEIDGEAVLLEKPQYDGYLPKSTVVRIAR